MVYVSNIYNFTAKIKFNISVIIYRLALVCMQAQMGMYQLNCGNKKKKKKKKTVVQD